MRSLIAIIGIMIGLVILAVPASAHAPSSAAQPPTPERAAPAQNEAPGICILSIGGRVVAGATAGNDVQRDDHHHGVHDPADHTHPFGEDTFHEKSSHSSLDTAHDQKAADLHGVAPLPAEIPHTEDRACGIAVAPPVPPPLG